MKKIISWEKEVKEQTQVHLGVFLSLLWHILKLDFFQFIQFSVLEINVTPLFYEMQKETSLNDHYAFFFL